MAAQATLPPQAADALRAALPELADDIIAAIAAEVPGYARPMEGRFGAGRALRRRGRAQPLRGPAGGRAAPTTPAPRDTYLRLGAGEYRAGRSLDALLAAYRVGARLAWRRFVEAGTRAGFPPDDLYDLGEAIFAYIDEISAESAAGFAEAQSEAAGESQRRRRALLRLLVQEPPATEEAVRTAAQAAGWALPRLVAGGRRGRGRPARGAAGRGRRRARRRASTASPRGSRAGSGRARSAPRSAGWRS